MTKLRLLLFEDCNRACAGCCNKQWDLTQLPVANDLTGYELIMLTGGEPMLRPDLIEEAVVKIRMVDDTVPIVVYTAKVDDWDAVNRVIEIVDGLTLTLHAQPDVASFKTFLQDWDVYLSLLKPSLRLNVFAGVDTSGIKIPASWQVKQGIEWIEDCPLPADEEFKRIS